jgi:tRNA(Ile)-lysidine synthase
MSETSAAAQVSDPVAAIATVQAGAWAVGVSGGGDSVALLELLRHRSDLSLHVVHLDHETRGIESTTDASFVRDRATACGFAYTIARRSEIEPSIIAPLPPNRSSRFRAIRLELFRRVIDQHHLHGVLLAHQADDQAETVMQRLLRGSSVGGLTGMSPTASVRGVTIVRPLLGVRRQVLRDLLRARGVTWREDASNASLEQQRNRVRALLAARPQLRDPLIDFAESCESLVRWLRTEAAPQLGDTFDIDEVIHLPAPVAREALRRWLALRGDADVPPAAVERLLQMTLDRASAPKQQFPGGVTVRRRGAKISLDR